MSTSADSERLVERIADLIRSGPLVRFSCDPSAVSTAQRIKLRATFYTTGHGATYFKPIVKCKEVASFEQGLSEVQASGRGRSFEAEVDVSRLTKTGGSFTLILEPQPNEPPVAYSVLHVFTLAEIAQARSPNP